MSEQTSKLKLPYIIAAQNQKHVTHNEALRMLDALIHIKAINITTSSPPFDPNENDCYIITQNSQNEWAGKENHIAIFQDGAWQYHSPQEGYIVWVINEQSLYIYSENNETLGWKKLETGSSTNLDDLLKLGINTSPDDTNRLAVKSDAILFSHDDVTPGSGDIRNNLNKAGSANTASLIFQDNWSGRAEIGLTGDDDFHIKVSPDGSNWINSITIDKATGKVDIPYPTFSINDEKTKISSDDITPSYLNDKLIAGSGIALNLLNAGANEQLEISTSADGNASSVGGGGKLLQIVSATKETQMIVNGTTWVDTGLSLIITPLSASSKILIMVNQTFGGYYAYFPYTRLVRDGVDLTGFTQRQLGTAVTSPNYQYTYMPPITYNYVDEARSTSPITYKTQFRSNSTSYVFANPNRAVINPVDYIIAIEIGA